MKDYTLIFDKDKIIGVLFESYSYYTFQKRWYLVTPYQNKLFLKNTEFSLSSLGYNESFNILDINSNPLAVMEMLYKWSREHSVETVVHQYSGFKISFTEPKFNSVYDIIDTIVKVPEIKTLLTKPDEFKIIQENTKNNLKHIRKDKLINLTGKQQILLSDLIKILKQVHLDDLTKYDMNIIIKAMEAANIDKVWYNDLFNLEFVIDAWERFKGKLIEYVYEVQ